MLSHDLALYSSHLPLDRHPRFGNNVLLAHAIELSPVGEFARFRGTSIGVWGETSIATRRLIERLETFSHEHGGNVRAVSALAGRQTQRWALCTGSGATSDTLAEAAALGVDTLIVGEGPHHTAVEAEERGICIIYAGHYATETLGIQAIARHAAEQFEVPWTFLHHPTGL
jgi:putative NIF3 family GTP cyclohydrolase 1 type 2